MLDPAEFGKAMAAIVREAQEPLLARIKALEERQPERGTDGKDGTNGIDGKDGASVTIEDVAPMIDAAVKAAVDSIPKPKDGEKGLDGKDAEPIEISAVVAELLAGDEMRTMSELHAAEAVARHFEANPVRHGIDGKDGQSIKGDPGKDGESIKGDPGESGVGLAGAMIDRDGQLVITTTKGETIKLGIVVGKDGERGKDGADFSDASIDYDGERGLIVRSRDGTEVVRHLPIPIDRGYWREGMSAKKADLLTHGGNVWIALKETSAKPCIENADDWRLFVRKGRDGADGKNGRDLGPPLPVKLVTPSA